MKGKLIVCEGLDCTGKTTNIKEVLKGSKINNFIYCKGIVSETIAGKISRRFPSTIIFFIELIYIMLTRIKPALRNGKSILLDRHDISITSYVPLTAKFYNRWIISVFSRLIIKPDAIVYFHLPMDEHIRRLNEKGTRYELILAGNPALIAQRKREYLHWYTDFQGPKIKIDTAKNNIQKSACILADFSRSLIC